MKKKFNLSFFSNKRIKNIENITEGNNNENFKVYTDKGLFFLKVNHTSEVQGIDRKIEYKVLQEAHRAGFGVKPVAFDPKKNVTISEFVELPSWGFEEIRVEAKLVLFAKAIRDIHQYLFVNYEAHISNLLDRYWYLLRTLPETTTNVIETFFQCTREKLDFYHDPKDIKFCHNDLCYGNFLKGENIIFIDWELSGLNDIYSDLAAFIHFHHLDDTQTDIFLQAYTEVPFNKAKLACHQDAILLRELLWVLTKLEEGHNDFFYTDYKQRCLNTILHQQSKQVCP